MSAEFRYFCARHVAPISSPLIEDGCVVVEADRVVAIGLARSIRPPRVDVEIDGLLMPGLVNAHTHLELTNVAKPPSPGTFQDWLLTTMGSMREADVGTFNRKRREAVREGIAQCLKFGVTAVGDISQNVDIVRPLLAASPLRCISYGECLGLGPRRARFDQLLDRAIDSSLAGDRLIAGVSPHAPYTVDADAYNASYEATTSLVESAWCTHLAETAEEAEFVHHRRGPFATLYERLGFDPGRGDGGKSSIIRWLFDSAGPIPNALLVHVNYCTDDDLDLIARMNATVAWCPRTHAYFGHRPHRWQEMLARGISVCVATDSCTSSPDLNVVDDLRLVYRQSPQIDLQMLWRMATWNAALQFLDSRQIGIGHLDNDAFADFIAWPSRTADPLREILETPSMLPSGVWIGGAKA